LPEPIDHAAFRAVWSADPADNLTLLVEYAKSNNHDLLALQESLEKAALHEIIDHAHRLAGAAHIMGALAVVDCCRALETAARNNATTAVGEKAESLRNEIRRVHAYIESLQAL
jgi:HPt (histidine-containing phosphotransfer) domain-containing protein